ncbi:hypothetical protein GCM10022377_10450 [Zhihengliuella alba]|uniref:DNA-binding protein n=1 Tax=Zhihengliuella alba TaxID=547018 RepID=A0ABP7D4K6_9MICC
MPHFRTPEDVANELGLKIGMLRRICRTNDHLCTRLERGRLVLTDENVQGVIKHLIGGHERSRGANDLTPDPFTEESRGVSAADK